MAPVLAIVKRVAGLSWTRTMAWLHHRRAQGDGRLAEADAGFAPWPCNQQGVYWMAVSGTLGEAGLDVYLVNARGYEKSTGEEDRRARKSVADEAAYLRGTRFAGDLTNLSTANMLSTK